MAIPVTIGICAYNEEKNIERTIRSVFMQEQRCYTLDKVLVVSSGSTDRTDDIVRELEKEFPLVKLLPQEKREGKASAVNLIIKSKQTEIAVLLNADNIFKTPLSLENLIKPFEDPKVGMAGGHPMPTNTPDTFIGFAVNVIWVMHHNVSMIVPKTGELIAFRDIGIELPTKMGADEDMIRWKVESAGYRTVYAPEATIINRGPENQKEYIKQRVRVNIGEYYVKKNMDYSLPTHDMKIVIRALFTTMSDMGFHPFKMIYSILLEIYIRLKARLHVASGKEDVNVWEMITTSKKV